MGTHFHPDAKAIQLGLIRGLSWVGSNLNEFAVGKHFDVRSRDLRQSVAQIKPLSELALTLHILARCGVRHPLITSVTKWIWSELDSGKLLTRLLLARSDLLPCCSIYASLFGMGFRAPHLDEVIGYLDRSDMARALPLPPWSAFALDCNLATLRSRAETVTLRQNLYLARLPEPWTVSSEIAYAITHEVFYLTNFGFKAIQQTSLHEYLEIWTPYWTRIFADEGDNDLVGEFAMVRACLRCADGHGYDPDPLQVLMQSENERGFIEGPDGAGSSLYRKEDTDERREFLGRYHTTLVSLMAYALELRFRH